LPSHAHRTIALLGKAAFVDDQATGRLAAQQAIRVLADLRQHRLVIPRRVTDEMLELLRATRVNHARHRGEGAVLRLRQSAQIARGHRRTVARLAAEEPAIATDEGCESLRDPFDQRSDQFEPDIRLRDELALSFRLPTRSIRLETHRFDEPVSCQAPF
jgi:hypothetical protein